MSSNSKLNTAQREARKIMKSDFSRFGGVLVQIAGVTVALIDGALAQIDGVTVALMRTGERQGKFSVSIASADEVKNRRKVGEFHALMRWNDGIELPCVLGSQEEVNSFGYASDSEYLESKAEALAYEIGQA